MSTGKHGRQALLLAAATAASVFLLAVSVGDTKPGQDTPALPTPSGSPASMAPLPSVGASLEWASRGFLALAVLSLSAAAIYSMVARKVRGAPLLAAIIAIACVMLLDRFEPPDEARRPVQQPVDLSREVPPWQTSRPTPPDWLGWGALSLMGAILLAGATVAVLRSMPREDPPERNLGDLLAQRANDAIDKLEAGGDLKETIIHCYWEMSRAVRDGRGIERKEYMTPHEFELLLQREGLPAAALTRLTGLFEEARYGSRTPDPEENGAALVCLQDLVAACNANRVAR